MVLMFLSHSLGIRALSFPVLCPSNTFDRKKRTKSLARAIETTERETRTLKRSMIRFSLSFSFYLPCTIITFLVFFFLQPNSPSLQWRHYSLADTFPTPEPWPERFHALLYMNLSKGLLQISNLWYDWPRGLNVNIFQKQLGVLLYDVEWDNGTTFYYTLGESGTCEIMQFEVGIPRPDFLDGANYLGTEITDGFLCNVWEKVDFIWYYEDVLTKRPVRWDFYDGISTHVITFEVGAVLQPDSLIQAPSYCFSQKTDEVRKIDSLSINETRKMNI